MKSIQGAQFDKKTKLWEIPESGFASLVNKLDTIDDIDITLLPERQGKQVDNYHEIKYKIKPYQHQLEAVQYGLEHDNWLLLDSPGLGKTASLILLAQELKEREGLQHCLIVCGINTLKTNWEKEIHLHSDLSCRILGKKVHKTGSVTYGSIADRVAELRQPIQEFFIITNIETLRSDEIMKCLSKGKENPIDMIIVDEIHTCKSPSAVQSKHLLKLNKAKHKIGATGTLLLNNPLDAYLPLKWIGVENSCLSTFKYYYMNFGGPFNNILLGFQNIDVLKEQLSTCSLRRTKDLLDLPPKMIINEIIDMDEAQTRFYNAVKQGVKEAADKVELKTSSLLALVARLRQATALPSMLTSQDIPAAKVERACDLARQITDNGDKVVIFSTFKATVDSLYKHLADLNPLVVTGDVTDDQASQAVDTFQSDPNNKVFIGTWQKAGTGITLTAASYMIFIDTPWTAGAFEQCCDRIHRIGTSKNVIIYNLICKDTFDERVAELIQNKQIISDYVVDDQLPESAMNILRRYIKEL